LKGARDENNTFKHATFLDRTNKPPAMRVVKRALALCKRKEVNIIEAEICPDHVHMLVEISQK
jgi:REP element-mobilizing transposase RayT